MTIVTSRHLSSESRQNHRQPSEITTETIGMTFPATPSPPKTKTIRPPRLHVKDFIPSTPLDADWFLSPPLIFVQNDV
jgi:hypothetical protein